MRKFYTGVGSRRTPAHILEGMAQVGHKLNDFGFILRSGGAAGADTAFARGANGGEIYRPRGDTTIEGIHQYSDDLWCQALDIAASTHPAWNRCSDFARSLHARNVFQVLGRHLDTPSKFLLCWTPDGAEYAHETSRETGGTGTAIRIADQFGVPCFNVARPDTAARIDRWLNI